MSARQIAQAKISNSNSRQSFHFITDHFEHAPDLPIHSLPQHHAQSCRAHRMQLLDARAFALEINSFREFAGQHCVPRAVQSHFVFLVDLVTRMRESFGKIAVVSQKQQALGLRVEPADIEKLGKFPRQQIEDGVARVRIAARRNETRRFVQHDGERWIDMKKSSIDLHMIALGRLRAEVGADFSVNCNAAGSDQFVAMTARADAGGSEEAI